MSKKFYLFSILINKKFNLKYIKYTISSNTIYNYKLIDYIYIYFNISFIIFNEELSFTNFLIY